MLRRIRDYEGWTVEAQDGTDTGTLRDFYFDDQRWTIRYLVVETGNWFMGRRVLISPMAVARVDWQQARLRLNLTHERVKNAPPLQVEQPVTRRYESAYATYYGYPMYWTGPGLWGPIAAPTMAAQPAEPPTIAEEVRRADDDDQHVRSVNEVSGYHIAATDGEIGHVEDFLFDEATWSIRYLVIDTSNWIGGRTVLIAPDWVNRVEWARQQVHVDVTREAVKESPEYHHGMDIDRSYEERLADAYRRQVRPL